MPKLKYLKEGDEMPIDFWNYQVNPVVGYYVEKKYDSIKDRLKYGLKPIKG